MDVDQELRKDLPANLQEKVSSMLTSGESVRISLPGSFGEALVVTDRRVIVVREQVGSFGPNGGIDSFVYLFSQISGMQITTSSTGGALVIEGPQAPQEIEKRAVFFPTYEQPSFDAAKDAINEMMLASSKAAPQSQAADETGTSAAAPQASNNRCAQCGAPLTDRSLFCSRCGANVGFVCDICNTVVQNDAPYCPGCGSAAVPEEGRCKGCGKIMPASWYSYCPWCGQRQGETCFACGAAVSRTWVYCGNCGRKLGSEQMDASSLRAIYSRRTNSVKDERTVAEAQEEPNTPAAEPVSQSVVQLAADHNAKGKTLFEQDDVEGAIREFQKAVELDADNGAYHCNLAVAYDDNDQDEEALAEYERTLELNPADTTALLYVGYLYSENDQADEAAQVWRKLIDIAPGTAEAQEAQDNLRHQGEL